MKSSQNILLMLILLFRKYENCRVDVLVGRLFVEFLRNAPALFKNFGEFEALLCFLPI